MAHTIKVTGYLEIEDEEYDDGQYGPLTEAASDHYRGVSGEPVPGIDLLEDLDFEKDDRT